MPPPFDDVLGSVDAALNLDATPPDTTETPAAPPPNLPPVPISIHIKPLWDGWRQLESLIPRDSTSPQPPAMAACTAFLRNELASLLEENTQRAVMAPAILSKIRQAVVAVSEQRANDAVTLLKNVLHSDPHNHTLLAILSQTLYFLASTGNPTMLHDARDHAQRTTIFSEKIKPAKLSYYRYLAIVSELGLDPERAINWLRDTGLLQVEPLLGNDGLLADQGIHLRAWAILATIPVELWHEQELNAIKDLMERVIGGAAVYAVWLRQPLLTLMSMSKTPLPVIEEMERLLHGASLNHSENASALHQLPLRTSDKPWLLRVRYLHALIQVAPVPAFDQALCNIALDGLSWHDGSSPDAELGAALNVHDLHYWRIWGLVITPYKDTGQPYLLPADETIRDGDMLASCDQMLATLADAEKALIKTHLWDDLKPWMVRWQLEHLLAAGTGSNKPRNRFAPSLSPYTHFYRVWQEPVVTALLASELITENARRGAFASMFEVLAALEGAYRLLDDPVHGLVASQKRALAAANRYNPKKFKSVNSEFGGGKSASVMLLLLPLGLLGLLAGVVTFSANWGQAVGLLLALAGVGGVVAVNLKKG
jgi:hypothetical protein